MEAEELEGILQGFYDKKEQLEMDNLYNILISNVQLDLHQQTQNINSVCGASVQKGVLSFQCFDCSDDHNHLICIKCFDIKKHINHKFLLKDSSGCCDCGGENTVHLGFCDLHQGHSKINKDEIISQISQEIKINTTTFIKYLNNILNKYYDQLKPQSVAYQPILIKINHLAKEFKLQQLLDILNVQDYYETFCKAIYFHNILIQFISWFIQQNQKNLFLITQILQLIDQNSNQKIVLDIFRRQLLFETLGPFKGEKIEKIFYSFHADEDFKYLTHQAFLNNYHYFQQFQEVNGEQLTFFQEILEELERFNEDTNLNQIKALESRAILQIKKIHSYNNDSIYIYPTSFRSQHTQFTHLKMIEKFIKYENCYQYLQSLIECQNKYYQNFNFTQDYSFIHLNLLAFRIGCNWFKNALYNSLQQILVDKFDSFLSKIVTQQECEDLLKKHFFLNQIIDTFGKVNKDQKSYKLNTGVISQNDTISAALNIHYQSTQICIINNMIKCLRSLIPQVEGKRNLSILILYQCYQKLSQDQFHQLSLEKIQMFQDEYLKKEDCSIDKKNKAYNFLIFHLLRRPIIINQIIIQLLVLEYFEGLFANQQQFLEHLLQIFQLKRIEDLKPLFDYLLVDSLQNLIIFKFEQQKRILFKYSSISKTNCQMESIDLAFMKLYLYLQGKDGLLSLQQIFNKFYIPYQQAASSIYYSILLQLMSSDLEFWNILQMVEESKEICPLQVRSAIHQTIINLFNCNSTLTFSEIEKYINQMKIKYNQNIDSFVEEICQLDQTSKKFTLKKEIKLYFDPVLFQRNSLCYSEVLDRLIDQRKTEGFINFGNFINYKADEVIQQSKSDVNQIFYDIFNQLANKSFIKQLILQIQQQINQPLQTYQLLNNLMIILSKVENKVDFELLELIEQLQIQLQSQDQKSSEYLNQIINNLKQLFENNQKISQEQNKQKQNQDKSKMKDKYLQKQIKFNLNIDSDHQQELPSQNNDENDYCQSCKLLLDSNDKYTPILIQIFAKQNLYETIPTTLNNILRAENFNLLNLSSCKHSFHFQCLINSFKQKLQLNIPIWLSSFCPVCKQSCNLLFPLTQLESHYNYFIQESEAILIELNLDEQLQQKYQNNQEFISFEIFYQLLVNILIQLFLQKVDFQRSGKIQIFKQFFKILQYNYNRINYRKPFLKFQEGQYFLIDIVLLIENYFTQQMDQTDFKQKLVNITSKLSKMNQDIVKVLYNCFEIEYNENHLQFEQSQKIQKCINEFDSIQKEISTQITLLLGSNFLIFRNRYIQNLCKKCGYFNLNFSNSKDVALCLLCLKTFCLGTCQNKQLGNLNSHVDEEHNGHSIFVGLSSGKVIITSYPVSIVNFLTLYYNNLGQELEALQQKNLDWNNYKLDIEKVQQISKIIQLNLYQHIVRNELTNQHTNNFRRNL